MAFLVIVVLLQGWVYLLHVIAQRVEENVKKLVYLVYILSAYPMIQFLFYLFHEPIIWS